MNAFLLLSQAPAALGAWAVYLVVAVAVAGVVCVAVRASGVPVPQWAWQIAGILVLAVVAVLAIRFLLTL